MTRLQSGLGPPEDLEFSPATRPLLCVLSGRAQGLSQVSSGKWKCESLSSYSTLCNPLDCSLPGSSVQGITNSIPPGDRKVKGRKGLWGPADSTCGLEETVATLSLPTVPVKAAVPMLLELLLFKTHCNPDLHMCIL